MFRTCAFDTRNEPRNRRQCTNASSHVPSLARAEIRRDRGEGELSRRPLELHGGRACRCARAVAAARCRGERDALALQYAGLSDAFHVIGWNAPGYILSDGFKTDTPTCRDYADAVVDFLAAVKIDRINIVGNSFGSRVAQCFAIHYPSRVVPAGDDRHRHRPRKRMSEEEKARIIAGREKTVATGGNGLRGARAGAARQERLGTDDRPGCAKPCAPPIRAAICTA